MRHMVRVGRGDCGLGGDPCLGGGDPGGGGLSGQWPERPDGAFPLRRRRLESRRRFDGQGHGRARRERDRLRLAGLSARAMGASPA